MNWSDVGNIVGKAAPAVGSALLGSTGAAIGTGIASLLGVEATPEAVAAKVQADPAALIELRKMEADMQKATISAQSSIITAEATGESWLQRNWRPLVMLWFAMLVGAYWFGWTPDNLSEPSIAALFDIVQFGLTGYIAGRSAEKVAKTVSESGALDKLKR